MMDLQEEFGLAYLFISHDMAVVERVSHRVAVMYLGEIVEIGPARSGHRQSAASLHEEADGGRCRCPIRRAAAARRAIAVDEIPSPFRPPQFVTPQRQYREAGPGHVVQIEP